MFKFYTTYRVVLSNSDSQFLAIGAMLKKKKDGMIFLIPGSGHGGTSYDGTISKEGKSIVVSGIKANGKETFSATFTKLTLDELKDMPEDSVGGSQQMLKNIKTDDDLQSFYIENFLHKYWEDDYKKGVKHD